MPFRQRIKRALTRSSTSSDNPSTLSKTPSKNPDPNVYQPGEKMPPMKYCRPVAPEHREKLEAFSFARAWRRKSTQSQYSPMGSRMPSRRNSTATAGRKSLQQSRLSMQAPRRSMAKEGEEHGMQEGSEEEGDVTNVGLSRQQTRESGKPRLSSGGRRPQTGTGSGSAKAGEAAFSPEDLDLALMKSHIDGPVPLDAHEEVNTEPPTQVLSEVPPPKTEEPTRKAGSKADSKADSGHA